MIELRGVSAGYGGEDVLRNVDLCVRAGDRLCVLGANGCGKTTLLRVIAGLLPAQGVVTLDDRPVKAIKRRDMARHMAMLGQMGEREQPFTVYDTVMLGRYRFGRGVLAQPSGEDCRVAERCLRQVGMLELAERTLDTLSGGQHQRVLLARTFAQEPRVILLDEPTNHLDLQAQATLLELLLAWASEPGRAIIGVMHDLTMALTLFNRALLLKEGRVVAFGPAEEALTAGRLAEAFDMDVAGWLHGAYARWDRLVTP